MKEVKNKPSKLFFLLLIVFISLNIGKHFEVRDSYVWGILTDYLVPVIYIQDILATAVLLLWFIEDIKLLKRDSVLRITNNRFFQVAVLFVFSSFFACLNSSRPIPSLTIFIRMFLYILLSLYISLKISIKEDFPKILKIMSFTVIFLSIVGISQYIKQGALFNNYLFFGEQPYSKCTWGISKETVLGVSRIPSYGFFRHPNIFGGFLSIVLIWLLSSFKKKLIFRIAFVFGVISLLLTFSYSSYVAFLLGIVFLYLLNQAYRITGIRKYLLIFFIFFIFCLNFLILVFSTSNNPSWYRRSSLLYTSGDIIKDNLLYGVGQGNFVVYGKDLYFNQPVHNVFALIFSEQGIFTFLFFLILIFLILKKFLNDKNEILIYVSFFQILFLMFLDHYFWTIHQTNLLFWILFGFIMQLDFKQSKEFLEKD